MTFFYKSLNLSVMSENCSPLLMNFRFKCSQCKNHYSVLPSIIPLFRWYLWCMQQWVLTMILNGFSMQKAAESAGINRRTVSRWSSWLTDKFKMICNIMCESNTNFIQYQSEVSS